MATGTKSLPNDIIKLHPREVLRDMHAEVLARRAFVKFLRDNFKIKNSVIPEDVFKEDAKRKKVYLDWTKYELILYTSEVPCGDCLVD